MPQMARATPDSAMNVNWREIDIAPSAFQARARLGVWSETTAMFSLYNCKPRGEPSDRQSRQP
jgi:hypothetical protein